MALESGFFNSVGGDRLYNAEDMSRYFEHILSNGIFKRINRCLEVSPSSGMTLTVAAGAGLINCHWFRAASAETVTIPAAHAVLPRFDIVVARLDMSDSVRAITLQVISGTPGEEPIAPDPVRTDSVHDLVLALVYVPAGASAITSENLTDVRDIEWYCGYVQSLVDTPILKTYHSRYIAQGNNVTVAPISVVGFNAGADLLNVYVNGFRLAPGAEYTVNTTTASITLLEPVDAGTVIDFEVHKPVMAEEIPGLSDAIENLVQTVTDLSAKVSELEDVIDLTGPIGAGDYDFGEAFIVTGFASSESTRIYFSIPFNRVIGATSATIKKMEVAARQSESYVLGSASTYYDIAGDIISTRLSNNGMLTIVAAPKFSVAPFNNAEVSFYINTGAVVTFA